MVIVRGSQHRGDDQRPETRARLIHRLVQAETPAQASRMRGLRKHHIARWRAHGLPRSFENDQRGRNLPAIRECQHRERRPC